MRNLPQIQVGENSLDYREVIYERNNLHRAATFSAFKGIRFPYFSDERSPAPATGFTHVTLDGWVYEKELEDEKLRSSLVNAFQNECLTHVKYLIYAKNAVGKGFRGLAKLYRAIADGEFHQARNHFHALGRLKGTAENLKDSLQQEYYEAATMYRENLDYARSRQMGLSSYAFHDAIEAEKVHHRFFQDATSGEELKDMEISRYFTCTSCGHTFKRETHPANCPICGAPPDKIREVT